jgi:hypothetical protein
VSAVINLLPPSEEEMASGNLFTWAGKTKVKVELEPEAMVTVNVAAKVTEAGVFDLNRISAVSTNLLINPIKGGFTWVQKHDVVVLYFRK